MNMEQHSTHLQKKQKFFHSFTTDAQLSQDPPNGPFCVPESMSIEELLLEIQALKELNYKLVTALNAVQDSVILSNESGKVMFLNESFEKFWTQSQNQRKEDLLGKPLFEKLVGSTVLQSELSISEWTETLTICETQQQIGLHTIRRVSPAGAPFLVHIVSNRPNTVQRTSQETLERSFEVIEYLPVGLGIWHMEEDPQQLTPAFRLVALNTAAKELIKPVNIPIGKTIQETLLPPNSVEVATAFTTVLASGRMKALDEFSLDGRARFAIKLFPLQHRYVGVVFEQPKAQNLISNDVFYNAYELFPPICSLLMKRYDNNGRPYISWIASNIASKKIRKGGWSPLVGTPLSQFAPIVSRHPKFEAAILSLAPGQEIKFLSSQFTNPMYSGSLYNSRVIGLPNNYSIMISEIVTAETIRLSQLKLDYMSQKITTLPDELKDYFIISDRLEPLSVTASPPSYVPPTPSQPQHQPQHQPQSQPQPQSQHQSQHQSQSQPQHNGAQYPHYVPQEHISKPTAIPSLVQLNPAVDIYKRAFYEKAIGEAIVSPQGVLLAANTSFARILGHSIDDFISSTFVPITHPDDVDKSVNLLRKMVAGEIHSFQMVKRFVHKQGHAVYCLLTTTMVRTNGAPAFLISQIQTVSHLQSLLSTEDANRDTEIYAQVFKNSPFATCIISKDGTLYNVNRLFCERLGFVGYELLGKQFYTLFLPEDQESIKTLLQWLMDGKAPTKQILSRLETKSKTHLWAFLNFFTITATKDPSTTHIGCILSDSA